MTDTYYAVFIGGPKDATALRLSEDTPSTLYIPTRNIEITSIDKMDTAPYIRANDTKIAVYTRQTIVERNRYPTETKVRFYFFSKLI